MSEGKKETYGESAASSSTESKRTLIMIGETKAGKSEWINHCFTDLKTAKALFDKEFEQEVEFKLNLISNSEINNESEYTVELDEILTQLHQADDRIVAIRQNTARLGVETRSMLSDLRKQLG
ncbi:MAG: hypothetical protein AAFW67_04875 [Cyanobacteria bacterium J06638_38]